MMKTSLKGISLIKKFEGFKNYPYTCPAGKLTIGYGHVIDLKYIDLIKAISPITEEKADQFLNEDLKEVESTIRYSVKVDLLQEQFDALASLIYNWGSYNFRSSQGLKKLNNSDYDNAANEFFSKENGVIKVHGKIFNGLVNRRQAEFLVWSGVNE